MNVCIQIGFLRPRIGFQERKHVVGSSNFEFLNDEMGHFAKTFLMSIDFYATSYKTFAHIVILL